MIKALEVFDNRFALTGASSDSCSLTKPSRALLKHCGVSPF